MKKQMVNPLLYDIKRTLTSKSVLILMLIMIAFGFAIIPSFTSIGGGGPGSNFANTEVFSYYDSGGYHFIAFAWNQFGQGVSGIVFHANLSLSIPGFYGNPGPQTTNTPQSPIYTNTPVSTDNNGEAKFSVNAPLNSSYYVSVWSTQLNGFQSFGGAGQPYQTYSSYNGSSKANYVPQTASIPAGQVVSVYGGGSISPVVDSSNSSQMSVQAIWVGPNGTLPTNYPVYYLFQNISNSNTVCSGAQFCSVTSTPIQFDSNTINESNMHLLGTMTSYRQAFSPPKLEANLTSNSLVYLALFYPNATLAAGPNTMNIQALYPPPVPPITQGQGTAFVLSFFQALFGIFIPLLAILGSYNSYGKDRVSGVLESVLAQPISRKSLSVSRFLSSFSATAIAVAIAIAVVDAIAFSFSKAFVSSTIILSSAGAFFVELAAFIAIMMLFSHVVKSSGALIGIGIGLFLVIDFFWGIIMSIFANFSSTGYGSVGYYQLLIFGQFLNPAQFVSLVDTYLTHQAGFVGLSFFSFQVTPEAYGVTIPAIIATGILWIATPLSIFLFLAIKRD